jgi:hypothetical protein
MTDFQPTPDPQPTVINAPIDLAGTTLTTNKPQSISDRIIDLPSIPSLIPQPLQQAVNVGQAAPRVVKTNPSHETALQNKWSDPEVVAAIAQLSDPQRRALIDLDAQRVSSGSSPLTKDDTIRTVQTLVTGKPATPAPERSMWNVPGNLVSNLGTVIKSIPRLPAALIHEATSLGQIDDTYGDNQIANLLNSPGIRMIPGAYVAGQLARGGEGVQELARNPLFTALDVLPAASELAKSTKVVKAATDAAALEGRTIRPLQALATRTLDDAGNVQLNRLGTFGKTIRDETKVGQAVDYAFGTRARDLSRERNKLESRAGAIRDGLVDDGTPEGALLARSNRLRQRAVDLGWDGAQLSKLDSIAKSIDDTPISTLSADELAYINEARELSMGFGNLLADRGELSRVAFPDGRVEFYDTKTGNRFNRARADQEAATRLSEFRQSYLSDQKDLGELDMNKVAEYERYIESLPKKARKPHQSALNAYLEAHGHDSRLYAKNRKNPKILDLEDALPPRRDLLPTDELAATLKSFRLPNGAIDEHAYALSQALASGDVASIRHELSVLQGRAHKASPATDPRFADTVRSLARRYSADQFVGDQAGALNRATKQLKSLTERHAPARFDPLIASTRDAKVVGKIADEVAIGRTVTPDDVARITDAVQAQQWDALESMGFDATKFRKLHSATSREVAATWQELQAAGADPIFVHSTSVSRARNIDNPQITSTPNSLSQTKRRALDISQGVGDLGVALTHQGMEILTQRLRGEYKDFIAQKFGMNQSQLMDLYGAQARDLHLADPRLSVRGHLERLINRSWDDLDQALTGPGLSPYTDKVFVPKAVAQNLQPHSPGPLMASANKVTGTFRVAVTSLSIRNLLYNALGGGTMVVGEAGPGALTFLGKAREMVKNPELILSDELRASLGGLGRDIREQLTQHPELKADVLAGKTLGRMWQEVQDSKLAKGVGKVSSKSIDMNSTMDDMYRVTAYLSGESKALKRGMSPEIAERAGLELARKVMMDYGALTPFERTVMRGIFPFYSFTNHVMRYVTRYPFDHPLRASIISSFGRAEAEDAATLPQSFLSSFFFGHMDSRGRQNAANLAPVNPFGDAASMFTIAGFLSATNPIISTALERVGLIRGEAELYPSLRYNPDTGRLDASRGNPITGLLENVIPQTAILTALLGVNHDFNERAQRDPAGASRYLASNLGLPILWRNWSIPGEVAKAEVARSDSEANAKSQALTSGNWNEALRYPGLRDDYAQLLDATPQELAQFQPQGADIYTTMIEQAYGRQARQASINNSPGQ